MRFEIIYLSTLPYTSDRDTTYNLIDRAQLDYRQEIVQIYKKEEEEKGLCIYVEIVYILSTSSLSNEEKEKNNKTRR